MVRVHPLPVDLGINLHPIKTCILCPMICGLIFIVRKNVHFFCPKAKFLPAIRDSHFVRAFLLYPFHLLQNLVHIVPFQQHIREPGEDPLHQLQSHDRIAIKRAETFVSAVNAIREFEIDSLNFKQAGFCHGGKGENVWKLFFHDISPIILLLAHHTQSERNRKSYG